MKTSTCISVHLTEAETYQALENYVRHKVWGEKGVDLSLFKLDDADSKCESPEKGAYFFFVKEE